MKKTALLALLAVGILGATAWYSTRTQNPPMPAKSSQSTALVDITLPTSFSAQAQIGKSTFTAKCATCHGENAVGQNGIAPPLIHKIYEPNHHADEAFQRAVKLGVRSHHWPFGDMPPVSGLTRGDVKNILSYIRALQVANGIS